MYFKSVFLEIAKLLICLPLHILDRPISFMRECKKEDHLIKILLHTQIL